MKRRVVPFILIALYIIQTIRPRILTDWAIINDNWIIILSIFLFVLLQVFLLWNPGISKEEVYNKSEFVRSFLEVAKESILNEINRNNPANSIKENDIRINIMLHIKRKFFLQRQRMKIIFCCGEYVEEEIEMLWYKELKILWWKYNRGTGTCGQAWSSGHYVCYDSENIDYSRPKKRLNKKQKDSQRLKRINSVLSIPITSLDNKRIIGVLNIDSDLNINRAFFNKDNVIYEGENQSKQLSNFLPDRDISL